MNECMRNAQACLRPLTVSLFLVLSLGAARAQSWADTTQWAHIPKPVETRDVVYADPASPNFEEKMQSLDVYRSAAVPAGAKAPVLVYMHGGAWLRGQRPASYGGFRGWLAAGFDVVTVEYRLDVPAPAAVQDVRCALNWIVRNAKEYGFDTQRVVTYGTSAGGHLALLAAVLPADSPLYSPGCKEQPHIAAVLDYYGPYHLEPAQPGVFGSPSVAKWIGPDPKPSLDAMRHALSPSTYVSAKTPPVFQAHGDADPTVPFAASTELKQDLDKLGVKNVLDTVPGGGHGGWTPEENQRVTLDSLRFLQAVGVLK
jgi:acetyl esterase/lipase